MPIGADKYLHILYRMSSVERELLSLKGITLGGHKFVLITLLLIKAFLELFFWQT